MSKQIRMRSASKKFKYLEKKLQLTCPTCQKIYQLLELHHQRENNQSATTKCLDNCWKRWKDLLVEHHNKEIIAHLNEQENEKVGNGEYE